MQYQCDTVSVQYQSIARDHCRNNVQGLEDHHVAAGHSMEAVSI